MIIYELECTSGHRFEGWFPNSEAFEWQQQSGLVHCAICGIGAVQRIPSGGHVGSSPVPKRKSSKTKIEKSPIQQMETNGIAANVDPVTLLKMVDHYVKSHFKNVGDQFAAKATDIHEGKSPKEAIYGTATETEKDLLEEKGVPFSTLPRLPESTDN